MRRYFFHLVNDINAEDREGRLCADESAARQGAVEEARTMIAHSITRYGRVVLSHRIDVHDENGPCFAVLFGDAFDIVP